MKLRFMRLLAVIGAAGILTACAGAGAPGPTMPSGIAPQQDSRSAQSVPIQCPGAIPKLSTANGTWTRQQGTVAPRSTTSSEDEYYDLKTNKHELDIELHNTICGPVGIGHFQLSEDADSPADAAFFGHGTYNCEDGGAILIFNNGPTVLKDDRWVQYVDVLAFHTGECVIYAVDEDAPNSPVKIRVDIEK